MRLLESLRFDDVEWIADIKMYSCVDSKGQLNFSAAKDITEQDIEKQREADQVYVFYADEPSVGIKTMRK